MSFPDDSDNALFKANALLLTVFLFLVLTALLSNLPKDVLRHGLQTWVYTDWLIDYSSGFVRRGLFGNLLRFVSPFIHPRAVLGLWAWFLFGAVVLGYSRLVSRSLSTLTVLQTTALLFLPSLLPFYLFEHAAFGRKEILGFLPLLWHLFSLQAHRQLSGNTVDPHFRIKQYVTGVLPLSLFMLPALVLIHEATFLLFVPVHLMISLAMSRLDLSLTTRGRAVYLGLIYAPATLAVLVVTIFGRATLGQAVALCKHWELPNALESGACDISGSTFTSDAAGAFQTLPQSLSDGASYTASIWAGTAWTWVVLFLLFGTFTAYSGMGAAYSILRSSGVKDIGDARLRLCCGGICRRYFLLPIAATLPLYVVGADFGRWFAVSCINFAMICLSREVDGAEYLAGTMSKTWRLVFRDDRRGREEKKEMFYWKTWVLLIVIFVVRLPYIGDGVEASKLKMVAEPVRSYGIKVLTWLGVI